MHYTFLAHSITQLKKAGNSLGTSTEIGSIEATEKLNTLLKTGDEDKLKNVLKRYVAFHALEAIFTINTRRIKKF